MKKSPSKAKSRPREVANHEQKTNGGRQKVLLAQKRNPETLPRKASR